MTNIQFVPTEMVFGTPYFYSFTHGNIISVVILLRKMKRLDGNLCVDSLLVAGLASWVCNVGAHLEAFVRNLVKIFH